MGLFEELEKIRQKPETARKRLLVLTLVIIMALIITLWWQNLSFDAALKKQEEPSATSPWEILKKTAQEGQKLFSE